MFLGWILAAAVAAAPSPGCSVDGVERIVAIGDVHGAYDRFVQILETTGLVDGQRHWAGGRAHLVQLGDIVDRGNDSRQALDLLRHLQDEARRAGGAVHALLGNHEVARMLGDLRLTVPGEYAAFVTSRSDEIRDRYVQSVKPSERAARLSETPLGLLEMRNAFGRDGEYGKWLRTLDAVAKINGIVFVHGGISPAVAAMSCDEINATVHRELTNDFDKTRAAPLASLVARADGPLWYRGLTQASEADVDAVLEHQHARAIVLAHTVTTTLRVVMGYGGKIFTLDTGMQPDYVKAGRASALEIRGSTFTAIYVDTQTALR